MHRLATSFILGYHGCDRRVGERLSVGDPFQPSANPYDWMGPGIYFWESNPDRALEFARESAVRTPHRIREPFAVGAVIELGLCCDLATSAGIGVVQFAYESLVNSIRSSGGALPVNSADGLRRNLDCAVFTRLHEALEVEGQHPFDALRGVFLEGAPAYPGAGFFAKTHVQIVVRNPACIKGVFRVSRDRRPL